MTASPPVLALRYLGGCPGHTRPEPVQVTVYADRFELQARGWGWRIGFDAVLDVGEPRPSPEGDGRLVPVVWTPPSADTRTLMLSGRDAGRLRFLLAQAVASAQIAAEQPVLPPPARTVLPGRRPPGPWQRELRRMRTITVAAMTVALVALVLIVGVAFIVVGRNATGSHWRADRALLVQRSTDIRLAGERNDAGTLSQALQALVDECHRLESYNGDAANTGDDFAEAQRLCAGAGVVLF